jgi:hypothetical protein
MGPLRYQHANQPLVVVRRRSKTKPYALAGRLASRNGVMVSVIQELCFAEDRLDFVKRELGKKCLVDPLDDPRPDLRPNAEHPRAYQYIIWRYEAVGVKCDNYTPNWENTGPEFGTDNPALGRRIVEKLNKTCPKWVKFSMKRQWARKVH